MMTENAAAARTDGQPHRAKTPLLRNVWFQRITLTLLIVCVIVGWHADRQGWWLSLPALPDPETAWADETPAHRLAEALNIPAPTDMSRLDEQAARHIRMALHNLRKLPKDARNYAVLGRVYEAQGRHKAALQLYRRAIELDPKDHSWHYHCLYV